MKCATRLDLGLKRKGQEDALAIRDNIWVVSDGMGGHPHGEHASDICTGIVMANLAGLSDDELTTDAMVAAIRAADIAIKESPYGTKDWWRVPQLHPGATIVVVAEVGDKFIGAWVGDSRIGATFTDNSFEWLTEDHAGQDGRLISVAGHLLPTHPIGFFEVDSNQISKILLCTDGLCGQVSEKDIARILTLSNEADTVAGILVEAVYSAGAKDNIGIVVLSKEK